MLEMLAQLRKNYVSDGKGVFFGSNNVSHISVNKAVGMDASEN
jgi:hypothetical protein